MLAYLQFGRDGNAERSLGAGWSAGEDGFRWMVDYTSEIWLDGSDIGGWILSLDLHPHVGQPTRPTQQVIIAVAGTEVYRAQLSEWTKCDIEMPPTAQSATGRFHVVITHPDAISPAELSGNDDHRKLAFAIRALRLYRPANLSPREIPPLREVPAAPAIIHRASSPSIVFVGNCQMNALSSLYRRLISPESDQKISYVASYVDATEESRNKIAAATTVVQQVLDFVPQIGHFETSAKIHLVPHAALAFIWPYAGTPHPLNQPEPTLEQSGPYNAELGDAFLNRHVAAGTAAATAVAEYLSAGDSIIARAERMMELHLEKQRRRDATCEIYIGDYIERHLRSAALFRSPNHPEPGMMAWIAGELFSRMGVEEAAIARLLANPHDVMPATETPIHPAIARHFAIPYAAPSRRYRFFHEGSFTFEEYAFRYMKYEWNSLLAEGLSLLRDNQTSLAIVKLEMALATAPRSAIARMALADVLERQGRLNDAIEYACQAVEIEPNNELFGKRLMQLSDRACHSLPAGVVSTAVPIA